MPLTPASPEFTPARFTMVAAGRTDIGLVRGRNEDHFALIPESGLAVVCDGMGGHAGGDIASHAASESVVAALVAAGACAPAGGDTVPGREPLYPSSINAAASAVRGAVMGANRHLMMLSDAHGFGGGRAMGTTIVGVWRIAGTDKVAVFHVGDSRLYRLRRGVLLQLTRDHSLHQLWLDSGRRGAEPQKNIITRALGSVDPVEPDISIQHLEPDDLFLLCTDGLSGMVEDAEIADLLSDSGDLDAACDRLVARALDAGGLDNVTVVLARYVAEPS